MAAEISDGGACGSASEKGFYQLPVVAQAGGRGGLFKRRRVAGRHVPQIRDILPCGFAAMRRAQEESGMAEKKKLSYEEKLQAVLYCIGHRLDYRQASEQYKITYQQIYNWVKKYQEQGETGLLDRRGKRRPPAEYSEEEKAAAKLRKLEVENRRLQMENDFLKKLNELEGRR